LQGSPPKIVPLLWGRARPSSEGGMGGSDRGAHLDNTGLGIFAYEVACVRRIDVLRDACVLYLPAYDVVMCGTLILPTMPNV
jgi:hypothetical protein